MFVCVPLFDYSCVISVWCSFGFELLLYSLEIQEIELGVLNELWFCCGWFHWRFQFIPR